MNILQSIQSKLILFIILLVLVWTWASLSFTDKINRNIAYNNTYRSLNYCRENAMKLTTQLFSLKNQALNFESQTDFFSANPEELSFEIITYLNEIKNDPLVIENSSMIRNIKTASESSKEVTRLTDELLAELEQIGNLKKGLIYQSVKILEKWSKWNIPVITSYSEKFASLLNEFLIHKNPQVLEGILRDWELEKSTISKSLPSSIFINGLEYSDTELFGELQAGMEKIKELAKKAQRTGTFENTGLTGEIILYTNQINRSLDNLREIYFDEALTKTRKTGYSVVYIFSFTGILLIILIFLFIQKSSLAAEKINNNLSKLRKGEIPPPIHSISDTEWQKMAENLNQYAENLKKKISFVEKIGSPDALPGESPFHENDELGEELKKLAEKISIARQEDKLQEIEEKKQKWTNEGLAEFGEIFRSEREDVKELAFKVIKKLVNYLDAGLGGLFIYNNDDPDEPFLELAAAFAYDRRKYIEKKIFPGEGLIGTCALEKETIYLTEIPGDYYQITSGLGESKPKSILIVPLKLEEEIFGIIEIASVKIVEEHEIRFTEKLSESIATTLFAVRINEQTSKLLEQSQEQATEMARQEEKMRINMQQLEKAQEESRKKETEMTGILNAVNASSLVAEYSVNGRFSDINEKFTMLLESTKDQIIGKHHSEFAIVDKYSDDYKAFWRGLRNGEIINKTEKFRLFSGHELWLKQTYTPIPDENGKIVKVLNIANDVTKTIQQRESLEKQANEITRRTLEMKILSEAVDTSIVKCEYSPEGIIISANENYSIATGYSLKELTGKNNRIFLKESEKQQFNSIIEDVLKDKFYSGAVRRSKPTGEEVWLMATFSPVKDESGSIYKIYFLAQDITEKKLKYQLLEEANKEIERLKSKLNEL